MPYLPARRSPCRSVVPVVALFLLPALFSAGPAGAGEPPTEKNAAAEPAPLPDPADLIDPELLALGEHHYQVHSPREGLGSLELIVRHNEQGLHVYGTLRLPPDIVQRSYVRLKAGSLEPERGLVTGQDQGVDAVVVYDFQPDRVKGGLYQTRPAEGSFAEMPVDLPSTPGYLPDLAWHWLISAWSPQQSEAPTPHRLGIFQVKRAREVIVEVEDLGTERVELPSGTTVPAHLLAADGEQKIRWHIDQNAPCGRGDPDEQNCRRVARLDLEEGTWIFEWLESRP